MMSEANQKRGGLPPQSVDQRLTEGAVSQNPERSADSLPYPYEFDRYVNQVKMADGAKIHNAANEQEAIEKAKALFKDSPGSRFVRRRVRQQ